MTQDIPATPLERLPVMADVARLAGVSHQTVSRVINRQTNLRPATRARVEDAIRQLGYRPNSAARALARKRSSTIGVIGGKTGFWGPRSVLRALQVAARESGYSIISTDLDHISRAEIGDAFSDLVNRQVEGIVLISVHDEAVEVARAQEGAGIPVVVVEGALDKARWTVGVDQVAGAGLATQHLLDLGHNQIVHLAGPMQWTEARGRLRGWEQAMHAAGLRPSPHVEGDWTAESGYRAGRALAQRDDLSAVFAANDQMALGLIRALWEAGRSVPGDVSVVGFDDIPEAAFMIPPLTTVRQDFAAVGHRAIEIMQTAIALPVSAVELPALLIQPELVTRASTAPN